MRGWTFRAGLLALGIYAGSTHIVAVADETTTGTSTITEGITKQKADSPPGSPPTLITSPM